MPESEEARQRLDPGNIDLVMANSNMTPDSEAQEGYANLIKRVSGRTSCQNGRSTVIINTPFSPSTSALVRGENKTPWLCELSHTPAKRVLFFKTGKALRQLVKIDEIL